VGLPSCEIGPKRVQVGKLSETRSPSRRGGCHLVRRRGGHEKDEGQGGRRKPEEEVAEKGRRKSGKKPGKALVE
jgi:hypothetical protein